MDNRLLTPISTNPYIRSIQMQNKKRKYKENLRLIKNFFILLLLTRTYYLVKTKQINPLTLLPVYRGFMNWISLNAFRNPIQFAIKYQPLVYFFNELLNWNIPSNN